MLATNSRGRRTTAVITQENKTQPVPRLYAEDEARIRPLGLIFPACTMTVKNDGSFASNVSKMILFDAFLNGYTPIGPAVPTCSSVETERIQCPRYPPPQKRLPHGLILWDAFCGRGDHSAASPWQQLASYSCALSS